MTFTRHMNESGKFAEALCLGYVTPINVLVNMFINDGMGSKAFRKNLLSDKFSHIGRVHLQTGPVKKILAITF